MSLLAAVSFLWGDKYMALGAYLPRLSSADLWAFLFQLQPGQGVFSGDTACCFSEELSRRLSLCLRYAAYTCNTRHRVYHRNLSDIIQVTYFKLTHGKRVFKMAPFHHHLEMGGWTGKKWKEKELFALFTSVSLVFAIISFIGIYNRFQL